VPAQDEDHAAEFKATRRPLTQTMREQLRRQPMTWNSSEASTVSSCSVALARIYEERA